MASYNKVILMGNLTRDVELRAISSGQQVARIGLAVNRKWRTPEGEQREEVTFVDCEAWGKTAEVMARYLAKGRPVFIEGRLKLDQWEDKEGNKQSKLRVVVESFEFIDSKGGGGQGGGYDAPGGESRPARSSAPAGRSSAPSAAHQSVPEDEIPF